MKNLAIEMKSECEKVKDCINCNYENICTLAIGRGLTDMNIDTITDCLEFDKCSVEYLLSILNKKTN